MIFMVEEGGKHGDQKWCEVTKEKTVIPIFLSNHLNFSLASASALNTI